jgi:hypothetical protein
MCLGPEGSSLSLSNWGKQATGVRFPGAVQIRKGHGLVDLPGASTVRLRAARQFVWYNGFVDLLDNVFS